MQQDLSTGELGIQQRLLEEALGPEPVPTVVNTVSGSPVGLGIKCVVS